MRSQLYERYYDDGFVHELHERLIRSRRLTRLLFGVSIREGCETQDDLFDLTSINLLRILRPMAKANPQARFCEIGVGGFAILSRALARVLHSEVHAGDIDRAMVEVARRHVQGDGGGVRVEVSDMFEAFAGEVYDVVFWNMPYQEDPATYLPRFLSEAPAHLKPGGKLVIGYNTFTLGRDVVLAEVGEHRELSVHTLGTASWNLHETLVLRRE